MITLEQEFECRASSEQNAHMMAALDIIAAQHAARPIRFDAHFEESEAFRPTSADTGHAVIDRSIDTICTNHGIASVQLHQFAEEGLVVDFGSGMSNFLSHFRASETVAVEIHEPYADFQAGQGHKVLREPEDALTAIKPNTVRLLNASWSSPLWARSTSEAQDFADQCVQALEPSGIAMVGTVAWPGIHVDWERSVFAAQEEIGRPGPWYDGDNAFVSHILNAFLARLRILQTTATLFPGQVDLAGYRYEGELESFNRRPMRRAMVPNYVLIRKLPV